MQRRDERERNGDSEKEIPNEKKRKQENRKYIAGNKTATKKTKRREKNDNEVCFSSCDAEIVSDRMLNENAMNYRYATLLYIKEQEYIVRK